MSVRLTARSAPPAIAAAGASSPLSGPTSTPSPPATSTAMARRWVPTPGSTTATTTPLGRYWMARTSASEPAAHVVGSDLVGEVEHGDVAGEVADDGLDHADELVGRPEVGQERDGVVGATHAATVGARARDLCRDANRAGADPPTAPALPARPGVPGAAS